MKELLYLKDDQLKDLIEKLFVGYREVFSDSKKTLDKYSIGLAHNKVILLLSMYEGISISRQHKILAREYSSICQRHFPNQLIDGNGWQIEFDILSFDKYPQ